MELKVKAETQGLISGAEIKTEGGVTKTSFISPLELARILGMVAWCHPKIQAMAFPKGSVQKTLDTSFFFPSTKKKGLKLHSACHCGCTLLFFSPLFLSHHGDQDGHRL